LQIEHHVGRVGGDGSIEQEIKTEWPSTFHRLRLPSVRAKPCISPPLDGLPLLRRHLRIVVDDPLTEINWVLKEIIRLMQIQ
jgi:hypothetical protein